MIRKFLLFALLLISSALAMTATLPNTTSVGYPYQFDALVTGIKVATPCTLMAADRHGTLSRVWLLDQDGLEIQTDNNGNLHTSVRIDDSVLIGQSYNFTLKCSNQQLSQNVTIIAGGTPKYNLQVFNFLDYANANPVEIGILVVLALAGYAVIREKTPWIK